MAICWCCVVRSELNVSFCRWKISKIYWSHRRLYAVRVRVKWVNLRNKKTRDYYKRLVRFNAIAGRITWFSCLLNVLIFNLLEQRKKENLMNGRCSPNRHTSERECAHTQCNLIHLKVSHLGAACIRAIRLHVCLVSNGKREAFQTSRWFVSELWMKVFVWRLFVFCTMWKRKLNVWPIVSWCLDDNNNLLHIYSGEISASPETHTQFRFIKSNAQHDVQMWSRKFIFIIREW